MSDPSHLPAPAPGIDPLADGVRQRAFFDLAGTVEDIIRLHEDLVSS
jgi:hypothetical protein